MGNPNNKPGLEPLAKIDAVCDDFENAIRLGVNPQVEDYLAGFQGDERLCLIHELQQLQSDLCRPTVNLSQSDTPSGLQTPTDQWSPLPNRYAIKKKLGCGGFGCVFLAEDLVMEQRLVAIKRPYANLFRNLSLQERQRFLTEAAVSKNILDHPGIVPAIDFGFDKEDVPYIIFEYVEGQMLDRFLDRLGKFSPEFALFLTAQLCETLGHAHSRRVIHRDVKPKNVIIQFNQRSSARNRSPFSEKVYLADFGLAKIREDIQQRSSKKIIEGTLHYMSPEQADANNLQIDPRSDIYSLGVMLYEMLTGRVPFSGQPEMVRLAILQDDPKRPREIIPDIPPPVETICLKAMAKNPDDRYASMDELALDIQRYQSGARILGKRPPLVSATRSRRTVVGLGGLALATMLIVSLVILSLMAERTPTTPHMQRVSLTTDPPGAEVTFWKLSHTRSPDPNQRIRAGISPVELQLEPGDYLVVAAHPNGSFHEVYRRVPAREQNIGNMVHLNWYYVDGKAKLPPIQLWAPNSDASMDNLGPIMADADNVTYLDYEHPIHKADADVTGLVLDSAIQFAEKAGKRLPSAQELQLLSRHHRLVDPAELFSIPLTRSHTSERDKRLRLVRSRLPRLTSLKLLQQSPPP